MKNYEIKKRKEGDKEIVEVVPKKDVNIKKVKK